MVKPEGNKWNEKLPGDYCGHFRSPDGLTDGRTEPYMESQWSIRKRTWSRGLIFSQIQVFQIWMWSAIANTTCLLDLTRRRSVLVFLTLHTAELAIDRATCCRGMPFVIENFEMYSMVVVMTGRIRDQTKTSAIFSWTGYKVVPRAMPPKI